MGEKAEAGVGWDDGGARGGVEGGRRGGVEEMLEVFGFLRGGSVGGGEGREGRRSYGVTRTSCSSF